MTHVSQCRSVRNRFSHRPIGRLLFVLATFLFSAGSTLAAGGSYDETDPFDEQSRVERLKLLGWDTSKEIDIEFHFTFADRFETRERHAQAFAAKLRRMGYLGASAKPCGNETACWLVIAPKSVRIDLKKLIPLSKELDQLASDEYGRYSGWECEFFRQADERILSVILSQATPTTGLRLAALEQTFILQCARIHENMEQNANELEAAGEAYDAYSLRGARTMMCECFPERARKARTALLPAERDLPIAEAEFTQRYGLQKVVQPCLAAMMRKTYGEDCPQMAARFGVDSASYCPCMQSIMSNLSEVEITQLGLESADYIPWLAQAKKESKGIPEPQPLFKNFMEREASCRK